MDFDTIDIRDIKRGQVIWECESGQNAALFVLDNTHHTEAGWTVQTIDILTGKVVQLFSADVHHPYAPRIYRCPQYSPLPNWVELTNKLAALALAAGLAMGLGGTEVQP